jgi:hypothetical protein
MSDRTLEFIGSIFCSEYQCQADLYLEPPHSGEPRPATSTGVRHLIVLYGDGYTGPVDRPLAEDGRRQFAVGVPDGWSKERLSIF